MEGPHEVAHPRDLLLLGDGDPGVRPGDQHEVRVLRRDAWDVAHGEARDGLVPRLLVRIVFDNESDESSSLNLRRRE